MATGKYLSLMASDDMFRRDALQLMADELDRNSDYGVAIAEAEVIDERGESTGKTASDLYGGPKVGAGNLFDELMNQSYVICNMFRREIVEKNGI